MLQYPPLLAEELKSDGFPLRYRSKRVMSGHTMWQSLMSTPIPKMISMASLGSQRWGFARCLSTSKMGCLGGIDREISSKRNGAFAWYDALSFVEIASERSVP